MQQISWAWCSSNTFITGTEPLLPLSYKISALPKKSLTREKSIVAGSVAGQTMKVLLCLCAWIAAATAHFISYPVTPYVHGPYIAPVVRPVTYTNFPIPLGPTFYSYSVIPNNVFLPGVPGVVQYLPVAPADGKGKPGDKKKPKGDKEEKDKKEETTEAPKEEEAETESETKTDESEDLA